MTEFNKKWLTIWQEARDEYREKAKLNADDVVLRRCYVELAAKQRKQIIELRAK